MQFFQVFYAFSMFLSTIACISSSTVSTSAKLAKSPTEFGDDSLRITVKHDCSGERCLGFTAKFTNVSKENIIVDLNASSLSRAGNYLKLTSSDVAKGELLIPAGTEITKYMEAISYKNKQKMSYVIVDEVVCSLRVDSACKDLIAGQGRCSGHARYYFQSHTKGSGWITLSFALKIQGTKYQRTLNNNPTIDDHPEAPSVNMSGEVSAPFWSHNSDSTVFYRVECDAKCMCKDVGKVINFISDHGFLPISDK